MPITSSCDLCFAKKIARVVIHPHCTRSAISGRVDVHRHSSLILDGGAVQESQQVAQVTLVQSGPSQTHLLGFRVHAGSVRPKSQGEVHRCVDLAGLPQVRADLSPTRVTSMTLAAFAFVE